MTSTQVGNDESLAEPTATVGDLTKTVRHLGLDARRTAILCTILVVAYADGEIVPQERQRLQSFIEAIADPSNRRDLMGFAATLPREARLVSEDVVRIARLVRATLTNQEERLEALTEAARIAASDGRVGLRETRVILHLVDATCLQSDVASAALRAAGVRTE